MLRLRKWLKRKRDKPRRKRPELFPYLEEERDPWPEISAGVRKKWWEAGQVVCGICELPVLRFEDLVPDHVEPGKMGGCKNHDESNLQPAHWWCNLEKGSKRDFKIQ